MQKSTLCFDYDFLLFQAACVTEKSYIKVINKITSEEFEFKSRTEFWGDWRKKAGGWLAELNKSRTSPYLPDDFIVEDFKKTEPFQNACFILDASIKSICTKLGTNKYYGYTGKGDTFRHKIATLQEYKGNRKDMIKPTHLEALKDYLMDKHDAFLIQEIEADDACTMDNWYMYRKYRKTGNESDKLIVVAVDKDAKGTTGFHYNPDKAFENEPTEIYGLGELWREEGTKGDVDGFGRSWLYYQIAAGDSSDNYNPSVLSDVKHGSISAYDALSNCKTDKDYWEALIKLYKKLYPNPLTFTNFRGDELTIDWLYVLQEITDLAHMRRWEDDRLIVKDILNNLGISYDC